MRRPSRVCHALPLRAVFVAMMAVHALGCAATRDPRTTYLQLIHPDQRPPVVGSRTATDSLFGSSDRNLGSDGISEGCRDSLEALVRRFTPTLVLPDGDMVRVGGRRYRLIPTDPLLMADTLYADQVDAAPYQLQELRRIPLQSLSVDSLKKLTDVTLRYQSDPDHLEILYFDFPGEAPRDWWREYARIRSGPDSLKWAQPTVWAHPYVDAAGRVVIQYWYFYPFNDYIGNHEGDWEHINVIPAPDHASIREIQYYFHKRSVRLPQGSYRFEFQDGTHPVVYVGGRAYMVLDYPIRIFSGEHNSGSHGNYPYAGEWEAAAALGHTESVTSADKDSSRIIPHDQFRVVLTPEPSRIDYRSHPDVLRQWAPLLLPVRWGFPSGPSVASSVQFTDVGNRAPFGPAFNAGWNRTAPGLEYPGYRVQRIPTVRSFIEDLLQPWYYLYIFRRPRYVHETRGSLERSQLERLGFAPRSGWSERGLGSPILGLHVGFPQGDFRDTYSNSAGFLLWRNFWVKARFGAIELAGGYQKFTTKSRDAGSVFIYPITAGAVLRGPEGLLRPYLSVAAGPSGWESRQRIPGTAARILTSGWGAGVIGQVGVEYYLRPKTAFDVGVRYIDAPGPGPAAGVSGQRARWIGLWMGHYVRF